MQRRLPISVSPNGTILVTTIQNQVTVARTCHRGKLIGIKEETALSLAKAFLPTATILPFNPQEDLKALYKLAMWCFRFSPIVGLDGEMIDAYKEGTLHKIHQNYFGITIDITGTERIHHGEDSLIKKIQQKLLQARFEARIAIAPTFGGAWALSRYSPEKIIRCNIPLKEALSPLPIEGLRIPTPIATLLREVGVKDIGTVLSLPRKALFSRYGKELLLRVDQALGGIPEQVSSIQTPHRWMVSKHFEFPLSKHESIVQCVLRLLHELVVKLKEKGRKGKLFILIFEGEDARGESFREIKEFTLFAASKNDSHIISVISPLVESLQIQGPLFFIAVTSKDTVPDHPSQKEFSGEEMIATETEELLNRFVVKLGRKKVLQVAFTNSYIPENSYTFHPVDEQSKEEPTSLIRERPSHLFQHQEEISAIAMLPDSYPAKIYWKGTALTIMKGEGPERIALPWTKDSNPSSSQLLYRDYFKVQDHTGRWLWVYRSGEDMKWYIQGMWA